MVATVIGGDPKNLTLGVVNDEVPDWMNVCRTVNLSSCGGQFSCRFLKRLETDNFKLVRAVKIYLKNGLSVPYIFGAT